ncbi:LysE family translocator [Sulfitobacter sp. S190]|uniref:LysE family translocator n=1 Tax=Sulfitobacter sp. S190 TaxID=2867022 RepID=UPI0021A484F5|nr:LysE family translocator [Sulfitobacter sp. S190]UWR22803.1 LysE family translocator [Sulfitobacter sp. S190]
MDPILFTSFLVATLLIVALPGPSCALAAAQVVKYGPRTAGLTIAGDALGSAVHITIAVVGLKTLIGLADTVLPLLQMAGGGFVIYLAWQSWTRHATADSPALQNDRSAFLAGFFACVTNPKAIVFFIALFPGFISTDHSIVVQSAIYGVVFIALDAASIWAYALLARRVVATAAHRIDIDRLAALGLLGVGLALVIKGWRETQTAG